MIINYSNNQGNGCLGSTSNTTKNFLTHPTYTYIKVADDGSSVWLDQGLGIPPRQLKIETEWGTEYRYIKLPGRFMTENIYLMNLVIEAAGQPKPGPDYAVMHINGNRSDDRIQNLKWEKLSVIYPYRAAETATSVKQMHFGRTYYVYREGYVKQGSIVPNLRTVTYDADTDLFVPLKSPTVALTYRDGYGHEQKTCMELDRLMDWAGYVNGNRLGFVNPVILHRDADYLNYHSDNLEYCEAFDPRYIHYHNTRAKALNALARKENTGRRVWPENQDFKLI